MGLPHPRCSGRYHRPSFGSEHGRADGRLLGRGAPEAEVSSEYPSQIPPRLRWAVSQWDEASRGWAPVEKVSL